MQFRQFVEYGRNKEIYFFHNFILYPKQNATNLQQGGGIGGKMI